MPTKEGKKIRKLVIDGIRSKKQGREVQKNSGYHYTKTIEKSQVFVLRPHIFVVRIVYFKMLRYLGKFLLFKEKQVEIIHYQDSYTIAITF